MLTKLITSLIGDPEKKAIQRMRKVVEKINALEQRYQTELTDEQVPQKTQEFRDRIASGESLDALLPEAFALVKNAARRLVGKSWPVRGIDQAWEMVHYDVQLIGGMVLHEGKIAEMRTGEGKTLVCTLPVYLNALAGKGVHVVTVNDYLAQRDAEWMGGLYKFLGMSVGVVTHNQPRDQKKDAYAADITYGTNNEYGFDYLRDNMAPNKEALVQRELFYAIVDEVDSILIDEARTPLIISAPAEESTEKYSSYSTLVKMLEENTHYNVDEKQRVATLTEEGIKKMEELMGVDNIYTEKGFEEVHHIEQALRAHAVYKKDVDYMIRDGEIIIVDEFTGRLMAGRRYGQGLHQAIEAKEGVTIKRESKTLATITFQNYFRMFQKLAGMTGTAKTEEEEFGTIYSLEVIQIPTNKTIQRVDKSDAIYKSEAGKFNAIANKVKEFHEKGQPVLVGTISVEKSEKLSTLLQKEGVSHSVLNAKYHEKEAEIVAQAGQRGAVTIATNMAGRGTDIKLGDGVAELGGLVIIGSERHESRRIDNQLRGRAGRQGDPGLSQFYVSMEDDLMRIFGGDRMKGLMERLGLPEDMPIENKMISRSLESAQSKVEGHNFDIRKHLVEYDTVINTHRDIIYKKRRAILESESLKNEALLLMEKEVEKIVLSNPENLKEVWETVNAIHRSPLKPIALESLEPLNPEARIDTLKKYFEDEYTEKEKSLPDPAIMRRAERAIFLRTLDMLWMRHIDELKDLREAVSLSGYGQRNPLVEYQNQAFQFFEELIEKIDRTTLTSLFHVKINVQLVNKPAPLATNANGEVLKVRTNQEQIEQNLVMPVQRTAIEVPSTQQPTVRVISAKTGQAIVSDADLIAPASKTTSTFPEVGRNDPCPCGSGKKYKKCHGA
ncbi:preprotein translocase subunit SecA [Candidatus Peregrinibacteria bacterium]|nr:MAG: preprotein translocase subunit SecA [Candidatus Peregrinibacteria bacterium]